MSYQSIQNDLPLLYRNLLPDMFDEEIPKEGFATCANCAMVCSDEEKKKTLNKRSFKPDVKCCSFYPTLPNYLVGSLLADEDPAMEEGKARVRAFIQQKQNVSPFGVHAPRKYFTLYNQSQAFGNSYSMLCPYYHRENGHCTVWKHREAVCSSFHCKTVAGNNGKKFWDIFRDYLSHAQDSLAGYVLNAMEFSGDNIISKFGYLQSTNSQNSSLTAEELDGVPIKEEVYNRIWKEWAGKEEAFYIKCYEMVKDLSQEKFAALTGIRGTILQQRLKEIKQKAYTLPEFIKLKSSQLDKLKDKEEIKVHLQQIDVSFDLPREVFDYFDGSKSYKEVQKELDEKEDIELDEELIISLFQNEILVEVKDDKIVDDSEADIS